MNSSKKPIGIKNNICVKGKSVTCGSKTLENFVPPYNATVMDKLYEVAGDDVGIRIFNMAEFSTGAEVTVFNRGEEIDCALSSDYDGTERQFAASNGFVALKPTYCSVSRYGLISAYPSLETIAPIAKTVRGVAELYGIICGADEKDSTTVERNYCDFAANIDNEIGKIKIGTFSGGLTTSNPLNTKIENLGFKIVGVGVISAQHAVNTHKIIACCEMFSSLARFDGIKFGHRSENAETLAELYNNTRAEGFGYETKKQILLGAVMLSKQHRIYYYNKAILARAKITEEINDMFKRCDVVATPLDATYTTMPNLAGLPAIAVKGVQLIGPKFSEELLFKVARVIENGGAANV